MEMTIPVSTAPRPNTIIPSYGVFDESPKSRCNSPVDNTESIAGDDIDLFDGYLME
jgi:hypothetical protein